VFVNDDGKPFLYKLFGDCRGVVRAVVRHQKYGQLIERILLFSHDLQKIFNHFFFIPRSGLYLI
jgi:hypothetical protein